MQYKNFNIIEKALNLLSKKDKAKLLSLILIQITLGGLDLAGVALIGALGALSVSGIASKAPGNRVNTFLHLFGLDSFSFQSQIAIVGVFAAIIMIIKTLMSMYFTKKSLSFLSHRSADFSAKLASRIFSQQYSDIKHKSSQEIIYNLTSGANGLILGVLGSVVSILSDGALILVMLTGLFVIDPTISLGSLIFFLLIGSILYFTLSNQAQILGTENARLSVEANEVILETLDTFRELNLRNLLPFNIEKIKNSRINVSAVTSKLAFMPYISKYVFEAALVFGVLLLAIFQFLQQDTGRAVGNLAIFVAAGSRIAPALLRLQQGFLQLKSSSGGASPTLHYFNSIHTKILDFSEPVSDSQDYEGFVPSIQVTDLNFKYKNSKTPTITNINLSVKPGELIAIVGKSGSGKSTLIDLILGSLRPQSGSIFISNLDPTEAVKKYPGAIAYVPQDVAILGGTISKNISLSDLKLEKLQEERLWNAIKISQLESFIKSLPEGVKTRVGERGARISGGQRQRLGIARAMYSNPKLIVLDEATSSLDAETEFTLNRAIQQLKGSTTLVVIAHRLATVREADQVCYIEDGKIKAIGTFESVRERVPDFDKQAKLLGI